jgi:hypothetical protein
VVDCHKFVWFELAIPKHAFILWLVFRNALTTKKKMCCWGFTGTSLCKLCFACQESKEHLFFCCSFSRRIWSSVLANCLILDPLADWDSLCQWCVDHLKGSSLLATIYKLCFGSPVYHLWRHQNDLEHGNLLRTEEVLIRQIKWDVRSRLLGRCSAKKFENSMTLVVKWGLQPLLVV